MSKLSDKLKKYNTGTILDNNEDVLVQTYLRGHQEKRPKEQIKYVGIEVECYGKKTKIELQKMFFNHDLEDYCMIGDDNSIERPVLYDEWGQDRHDMDYHTYEIRLLIPQGELKAVLAKFGKVFKLAKLKVNDSCGLHVHLDMRSRDLEDCERKLVKFKDALYALVETDRWNNKFCKREGVGWTDINNRHQPNHADRHVGINLNAYGKHRTIEIRTHHGTVDTNKILKWVKLLLNVIDAKSVPTVKSKKDVLKWPGLKRSLRTYVNTNFKEEWFEKKKHFTY